jgi:hypothetical protein
MLVHANDVTGRDYVKGTTARVTVVKRVLGSSWTSVLVWLCASCSNKRCYQQRLVGYHSAAASTCFSATYAIRVC